MLRSDMLRLSLWPRLVVVASLSLSLVVAPARSQTGAPPPPSAAPAANVVPAVVADPGAEQAPASDIILVTGQRPGPGLWKVSQGDHVLWVFGTYGPLPKNMEWRSQQVETILAQSQEYLKPPGMHAEVGFFKQVAMLPFAIGVKKNPDGATLKDLVPAPVYARWLVLKSKYLGEDDGIERERPIFAAATLYDQALRQADLYDGELSKSLGKLIKQSGIKQTDTQVKVAIDDPVTMLREFKKTPLEDAACFANTLARLEDDIDAMRVRANAWAKGDLAVIEKLSYADRRGACNTAVFNSAVMQSRPGMRSIEARIQDSWLAAAEKALAANASTFATLSLNDLLDPKGAMAALQAKGYVVEKPQ